MLCVVVGEEMVAQQQQILRVRKERMLMRKLLQVLPPKARLVRRPTMLQSLH